MKKNLPRDFSVYIAAKIVAMLVRIMPYEFNINFGKFIGLCTYYLSRRKKRTAYANLKAVFKLKYSQRQIKKINRNLFVHLGMMVLEILSIPKLSSKNINRYVKLTGFDKVDAALKLNKGVILLTAHFGNWELCGISAAIKGYPMVVLAKEQKIPYLNQLLNAYRQKHGCRVVPLGMAVREIIKALKKNKIVGMLGDQGADKNSVLVDFMGRIVPVPQGVVAFAQKTNAVVLPTFCVRRGKTHEIIINEPLKILDTGNIEEDTKNSLEKFNELLEKYIREYPEQWIWVYKRWKYSPQKQVLILSDTKPGHVRQSLAVAELLKTEKREISTEIIEVKYKNSISRILTKLCGLFAARSCQGCLRCLKFTLEKKSYERLRSSYADIIISAGASLAAVNRLISLENNARNIVLMRPSFMPYFFYNLVILPKHDNPPRLKNIVVCEGALIFWPKEKYQAKKTGYCKELGISSERIISVLIGGDTKGLRILPEQVEHLLNNIKQAANDYNAQIMLTTSRRTSRKVEAVVENTMKDCTACCMRVIASVNNDPEVMPKIFTLSTIIIASGDSVSMVSEAASTGAYVIVFMPVKQNSELTKHERFLNNLAKSGYIKIVEVKDIRQEIAAIFEGERSIKVLNDAENIRTAVERII